MELLEVVIQGVRGFPQMARLGFGPAVSVVHPLAGNERVIAAAVLGLLYPDALDAGADELSAMIDPGADVSRVGVLVRGRDGVGYRILRDLKAGKWSVLKEGPGGFQPVSSRPGDVGQLVTATMGFPQKDIFRDLLVTQRHDLPSQRADAFAAAGPPPLPPDASGPMGMPIQQGGYDMGGEFDSLSDDEKRAKLKYVESALAHNKNIREIESELDGLQREAYDLEEQLKHIDALQKEVESANKELKEYEHLSSVPDDFLDRVQRWTRNIEQGKRDLKRIGDEKAGVEEQLKKEMAAASSTGALLVEAFRDKKILVGTAVGVGGILLGVVGAFAWEPLRWAAFLDVPGFAWALWGAWEFIGEAEGMARLRYRIDRLEEDRAQKAAQLAKDEHDIHDAFARINYAKEDVLRVENLLSKRAGARQVVANAQQQLDAALTDPRVAAMESQRQKFKAAIAGVEDRLYKTGGYMGDSNELRRQAEELRALLDGRQPSYEGMHISGPQRRAPGMAMRPQTQAVPAGVAQGGPADPTPKLVQHARDLLMVSVDDACQMLQARVGQYLAGLSDRRYGQVLFGPAGEMAVVETASGRSLPFAQLTPGDRDLAYLSLKLTIVEASVRRGRLPVLIEGGLDTIPEPKDPLLVRMVQFLGTNTQVVLMTKKPALVSAGEHRVTLG